MPRLLDSNVRGREFLLGSRDYLSVFLLGPAVDPVVVALGVIAIAIVVV